MKYVFEENKWNKNDFIYAHSGFVFKEWEFKQSKDCIENMPVDDKADCGWNHAYISMVHKDKRKNGVTVKTKCYFENYGAPLIVIAEDIKNEDGEMMYQRHYEVVAWEGGCNTWYIIPDKENKEKRTAVTGVHQESFDIGNKAMCDLAVTVKADVLDITLNGYTHSVKLPVVFDNFYVGITACEDYNKFYDFEIID